MTTELKLTDTQTHIIISALETQISIYDGIFARNKDMSAEARKMLEQARKERKDLIVLLTFS